MKRIRETVTEWLAQNSGTTGNNIPKDLVIRWGEEIESAMYSAERREKDQIILRSLNIDQLNDAREEIHTLRSELTSAWQMINGIEKESQRLSKLALHGAECQQLGSEDTLIYSRKHSNGDAYWWRPNGSGYTSDLRAAGRYTAEEAESCCRKTHGDNVPVKASVAEALFQRRVIYRTVIEDILANNQDNESPEHGGDSK